MPSGITGATITTLTNGTTANASDVMASLNSLKNNGINNDGGTITTDGSGGITAVKFSTANGQIRGTFLLATPYHLTTNPTISAGSTTTLTCTGGATGVPSGAKAVLIGIGIFSNTSGGGYVQGAPHGGTFGQYWGLSGPVAGQYTVGGMVIAPVDSNGQIDVKANVQACVLQDWYIYGYVI